MRERSKTARGTRGTTPARSLLLPTLGAAIAIALLFFACSSAPESLESTSWQLTDLGGVPPVPGSVATIQFDDTGGVNGTTGCNSYSGAYETQRADIQMGPFRTTLMACPGALGVQETALFAVLERTTSYAVDNDTLSFLNSEGQTIATLSRLSNQLPGTSWDVTSYNTGSQAVRSLIIGTEITLTLAEDGSVSGNASCNDYTGTYELDGDRITIGPLATTRKACQDPQGVMDQEMQYLAALQSAEVWANSNTRLELRDSDGSLQVQANPGG
jgi:heat shock protein HslJ